MVQFIHTLLVMQYTASCCLRAHSKKEWGLTIMDKMFSSRLVSLPRHRIYLALCTLVLAFTVFTGTATAHAAATPQTVHLAHGFSTQQWELVLPNQNLLTAGTITFYNRNVELSGGVQSLLGFCAVVEFQVGVGTSHSVVSSARRPQSGCVTTSALNFDFILPANVPGGASEVTITLFDTSHHSIAQQCDRNGCIGVPILV
jgi:hypothetical protein